MDRTGDDVLSLMELVSATREMKLPVVALAADKARRQQARSFGTDHVLDTHGPHSEFRTTILKALAKPQLG